MSKAISVIPSSGQQPPKAIPPESLIIGHIQAHIRKGDAAKERATQNIKKSEDHYIAAGQWLTTLKAAYAPTWAEWENTLKVKVKLSTGRASELMQLADGRKDLQQIREEKAQSVARLRAQGSSLQADVVKKSEDVALAPSNKNVPDFADIRLRAAAVILDIMDDDVRAMVLKQMQEFIGEKSFDRFRNAIAEIYQQLARAGK